MWIIFIYIFYFRYCVILVLKFPFVSFLYFLSIEIFYLLIHEHIFLYLIIIFTIATLKSLSGNSDIWDILRLASVDCYFSGEWVRILISILVCQVIVDCILGIVMVHCGDWILFCSSKNCWHFWLVCFRRQLINLAGIQLQTLPAGQQLKLVWFFYSLAE